MFLGKAIYESLNENGELTSYIMTPKYPFDNLMADNISDIDPRSNNNSIDVGPLRLYAQENGIGFSTLNSKLGGNSFKKDDAKISLNLNHSNIPLKSNYAGFYGLLLPKNYTGNIGISIKTGKSEHATHANKVWFEDTQQMYISSNFCVYADQVAKPNIRITAELIKGKEPTNDVKVQKFSNYFSNGIDGLFSDSVASLINEINKGVPNDAPSVFICHSSIDKPYARRVATSLSGLGVKVWLDEAEIKIGDSIISKIENGIFSSNNLLIILTSRSVSSNWCKEELRMALAMQINNKSIRVLPALFEDCIIPGFLIEKAYADFRNNTGFDTSIKEIYKSIVN